MSAVRSCVQEFDHLISKQVLDSTLQHIVKYAGTTSVVGYTQFESTPPTYAKPNCRMSESDFVVHYSRRLYRSLQLAKIIKRHAKLNVWHDKGTFDHKPFGCMSHQR